MEQENKYVKDITPPDPPSPPSPPDPPVLNKKDHKRPLFPAGWMARITTLTSSVIPMIWSIPNAISPVQR